MAVNYKLIHKKSVVVENEVPKLPTSGDIAYGEIAINYAKGYETLSIRNNNDEIVPFSSDGKIMSAVEVVSGSVISLSGVVESLSGVVESVSSSVDQLSGVVETFESKITNNELVTSAALNDLKGLIDGLRYDITLIQNRLDSLDIRIENNTLYV